MPDQVFDIVYRGSDELTPAAGAAGGAMKKLGDELEAAQKRSFELTHSAQEAEVRTTADHYAKLDAQLTGYIARLDQAKAAGVQKMMELRVARVKGDATTEDVQAAKRYVHEVTAVRARAEDTLVANRDAKLAEEAALRKRHEDARRADEVKAGERRRADMQRLDDQIFNSSHTSQERELRAVRRRSDELRQKYAGDADMHRKIAETEQIEVTGIRKRYREERVRKLISPRAWRAAVGGFIAAAGVRTALGIEKAVYAAQEARDLEANRSAKLQDVVASHLAANEAAGGMLAGIPIVGDVVQQFHALRTNRPMLEALGRSAEKASGDLAKLGDVSARAAAGISAGLAQLYHYTPGELAQQHAEQARLERSGALYQGREAIMSSNLALAQAMISGVGVPQARRAVEQSETRFISLQKLQAQQEDVERRQGEEAQRAYRAKFGAELVQRGSTAERTVAGYMTPERRRESEVVALALQHQAELERFATREQRLAELSDRDKWRQDWIERELAQRMVADPSLNEQDLRAKLGPESFDAHRREMANFRRQEQEREWVLGVQKGEREALAAQQQRETADAGERAAITALSGSRLQSSQREAELRGVRLAGKTEDPREAVAKENALKERYAHDDEDRLRRHQVAMRDAEASAALDRETHRKREMEKITEGYAEDLQRFRDNAEEKQRIEDEIAAKRRALAVQQAEERRQERSGAAQQVLRVAGGPFGDLAELAALRERYLRTYQQLGSAGGGHPRETQLLLAAERAEEAELRARQNWTPNEVQAIGGIGYRGGRPAGFDAPMTGLTTEIAQLRALLERIGSNLSALDSFLGN